MRAELKDSMFRFRLRTMLLAVAMLAVVLGGWAGVESSREWIKERHRWVYMPNDPAPDPPQYWHGATGAEFGHTAAPWPLSFFGERGVGVVYFDQSMDRQRRERL